MRLTPAISALILLAAGSAGAATMSFKIAKHPILNRAQTIRHRSIVNFAAWMQTQRLLPTTVSAETLFTGPIARQIEITDRMLFARLDAVSGPADSAANREILDRYRRAAEAASKEVSAALAQLASYLPDPSHAKSKDQAIAGAIEARDLMAVIPAVALYDSPALNQARIFIENSQADWGRKLNSLTLKAAGEAADAINEERKAAFAAQAPLSAGISKDALAAALTPAHAPAAGEDVELGAINKPAHLDRKVIELKPWTFGRFFAFQYSDTGWGEPLIDGKAADQSLLDFKHARMKFSLIGSNTRHDYSFIATKATPAKDYWIEFPGKTAFTVRVGAEAARASRSLELGRPPDEVDLQFGSEVAEQAQSLMKATAGFMDRNLYPYARALTENTLGWSDAARLQRIEEISALRAFYADVVSGKDTRPFGVILEALRLKERPVVDHYLEYLPGEPAFTNQVVKARSDLMNERARQLKQMQEALSRLEVGKRSSILDFSMKASERLYSLYYRFRLAVLSALGPLLPAPAPSAGSKEALLQSLAAVASEHSRYAAVDPSLGTAERDQALANDAFLASFAVERKDWSLDSLRSYVVGHAGLETAAQYEDYLKRDRTLSWSSLRHAAGRIRALRRALK